MKDDTLQKEWEEQLNKAQNIYIYGAGKIGKRTLSLIARYDCLSKVKAFLTTIPPSENDVNLVNGIPVIGIDALSDEAATIFIAVTDAWQEEILRELNKRSLNNYALVYKYSFLLEELEQPNEIPSFAFIDTRELLVQQFIDGNFNRLDVIVRVLAVENYYGKNDYGMNLYGKMQRARNLNINNGKYDELAVPRFEALIESVEKNGFDASSEIIVDRNLKLVDGAHRIALAIFHHIKEVKIRVVDEDKSGIRYGEVWFLQHFLASEIQLINQKLNNLSSQWFVPIAGIIWPPAVPFADDIIGRIKQKYSVSNLRTYSFADAVFTQFVKGVYHVDSIADWKVEYKLKEFAPYKDKSVVFFDISIPYPDFRIKDAGTSISKAGEDLKKEIREAFKDRIENYHPDVIFHTADNFHQSEYMRAIVGRDFSLRPFFESIAHCRWMLVKLQSDYLPEKFPDSIPLYKDIDMIVSEKDFDEVVCAADVFLKNVSKQFNDKNLCVRKVYVRDGCAHIRQEQEGFLLFQADCSRRTEILSDEFIESALERRIKKDCYWVPDELDECIFRLAEFKAHPQKKKHKLYIERYFDKCPESRNLIEKIMNQEFDEGL